MDSILAAATAASGVVGHFKETRSGVVLLTSVGLAAGGCAYLLARRLTSNAEKRLPGPRNVPLFGCLSLRDQTQWHVTLAAEAEKHPHGWFEFYAGQQLVVVVADFDILKELLEMQATTGRQSPLLDERKGIVMSEGELWTHHRRTSLRILRDFAFARPATVEMIDAAMVTVFEAFDRASDSGEPTQLLKLFLGVTNSVIAQLTFGRFFDQSEPQYMQFCDAINGVAVHGGCLPLPSRHPCLRRLFKLAPLPGAIRTVFNAMRDFTSVELEKRRDIVKDENVEPACLCDVYLIEQRKAEANGDFVTYSDKQVKQVCVELFLGGTDTTARTTEWLMLRMALHPDIQRKVHEELDSVVGQARQPRLTDKAQLHYVNAVMDETYRCHPILALGLFHRCMEDVKIRGFTLPKDSLIMPHIYGVHRNIRHWQSPEEFNPSRFLDKAGRYTPSSHVIPFLIGKRSCLGEALARMEVFLMFTMLMQRYRLSASEETLANRQRILRSKVGFLYSPDKYGIVVSRR